MMNKFDKAAFCIQVKKSPWVCHFFYIYTLLWEMNYVGLAYAEVTGFACVRLPHRNIIETTPLTTLFISHYCEM